MKLHLPVNLLRAVLSLCIAQVAIMPSWAVEITEDTVYGYGGTSWTADTWHTPDSDLTVTSNPAKEYSVTFNGADGSITTSAMMANGVTVEKLSSIKYISNQSTSESTAGGAIYSGDYKFSGLGYLRQVTPNETVLVNFKENDNVLFESNKSEADYYDIVGGAIYTSGSVSMQGNGTVSFQGNSAESNESETHGGAIFSCGRIEMNENTSITFNENRLKCSSYSGSWGGAIFSVLDVRFANNGDVTFSSNKIDADYGSAIAHGALGGAIMSLSGVTIGGEENGNGNISFIGNEVNNTAENGSMVGGGAIAVRDDDRVESVRAYGVRISNNASVTFQSNKVSNLGDGSSAAGGAIYIDAPYGDVEISNNTGIVSFKDNVVSGEEMGAAGGAIAAGSLSDVFSDTDRDVSIYSNRAGVTFDGNKVRATGNNLNGGAIFGSNIILADNGTVNINNNTAIDYGEAALNMGGAICSFTGDVRISLNAGDVSITNNGIATQDGSIALGGAIFSNGLSIVDNAGDVTFAGNFESCSVPIPADSPLGEMCQVGTVLRSIVVAPLLSNGSGYFELAAADGKSITFHDSVYVAGGSEVIFNACLDLPASLEANAEKYKLTAGDIVFSGAHTEKNLKKVQDYLASQGFAAAESNLEASRTSTIGRDVIVASGGLRVEDGAVLRLYDDGFANGSTGGSKSLYMAGTEFTEMAADVGINYTAEDASSLLVTSGSRIEASTITLGEYTEFTVKASEVMAASTFSMSEVGPAAELQADNVTLMGGMVYTMDGAYTTLVGENNTLTLDFSNGLGYTFNFDKSLAYQEGEMMYFVLFTGVENLDLVGAKGEQINLADVIFEHNLQLQRDAAAEQPVLGYHAETGTVYVSMKGGSPAVPEPTTATLSLLALMGLAARRRRK